ncbi:hypothetical protein HMI54_014169 [Coelomomyces lativittatus]|nr:hypothetical protein HMI54_014169 [Coelomomyces lativittatus]
MFALNTSIHRTLGETPFFLFFLRDPHTHLDLWTQHLPLDNESPIPTIPEYKKNKMKFLAEAIQHVHQHQAWSDLDYLIRPDTTFNINDIVSIYTPPISNAKNLISRKLTRPWTFPFRIIDKTHDNIYTVRHLHLGTILPNIHVSRLKKYFSRTPEPLVTEQASQGECREV